MKAALGRVITKLVIKSGVTEEDFRCSYSCHARNVYGTANTTLHIEGRSDNVFACSSRELLVTIMESEFAVNAYEPILKPLPPGG